MHDLLYVFIFVQSVTNLDKTEEETRALYKREYLMIIRDDVCKFCIKTYVVTTPLNFCCCIVV